MSEGVRFPIRVGRGQSRVTIYNRTDALPYYRICYRLGAIRKQRTCNSVDSAICCADAMSRKLGSKDAAVTLLVKAEILKIHQAGVRLWNGNKHPTCMLNKLSIHPLRGSLRAFGEHKALQRRFGKVNGEKPKGLDG